jgi:dihydroxy-acid dehydratase
MGLRDGLTSYGDPDFSLFLRKVFIKAAGYEDDALDRPIVGIADTSSDFNPCHGNVPSLIAAVRRGVMLAGGLPLAFPTISLHESFVHPTSMFLRNLMSMDTEEMIRAQPMDAVVLIGGCDKTLPAQLMGAASAKRPAIVLPVGPMLTGSAEGRPLGACTDCRRLWADYRAGRRSAAELEQLSGRLAPSAGTCMVMGTASTMACVCEALGVALPGSGTIPAVHADRLRAAERAGRLAAQLAATGGPSPAELITPASLRNAFVVLQAIGGSTNAVVHLAAIAGRCGIELDYDELDAIGKRVPVLVDLKPSGEQYMEDLNCAGGVPQVLRRVADELDLDAPTVSGQTLGETLAGLQDVPGEDAVRPLADPVSSGGALAWLRGNLAPRGAILKASAASEELRLHEGSAVVFESVADMAARIDDEALDIKPDDVLVLRGAGPVGAAMPEAGNIPIPRRLAQAGVKDMVRISDARMSGTAYGTIVLHASPEAAVGGPLAVVRDGDRILLDVAARRLELLVEPGELESRLTAWSSGTDQPRRGYAALHHRSVLQADAGADFDFLTSSGGG